MNKLLIAGVIIAMIIGGSVLYSEAGRCLSLAKDIASDEIINDTCPVMGNKVIKDTPYKTVYNGKTIGFCCASCLTAFKKNPEKYKANLKSIYEAKVS